MPLGVIGTVNRGLHSLAETPSASRCAPDVPPEASPALASARRRTPPLADFGRELLDHGAMISLSAACSPMIETPDVSRETVGCTASAARPSPSTLPIHPAHRPRPLAARTQCLPTLCSRRRREQLRSRSRNTVPAASAPPSVSAHPHSSSSRTTAMRPAEHSSMSPMQPSLPSCHDAEPPDTTQPETPTPPFHVKRRNLAPLRHRTTWCLAPAPAPSIRVAAVAGLTSCFT